MDIKIVFAKISSESEYMTDNLLRLICDERRERINRFRFDIDRKLSLYSELLVRYQAWKELKLLNDQIVFEKSKNGKPLLWDHPEFHFNISHTRNAIAIAFSNNEIGVDVEPIKPVNLAIANRFFTSSEQEYITSHDNPEYSFYEVWTQKEAYIKYLGTGLSTPLNSFNVLDDNLKAIMNTFFIGQYIVSVCCNLLINTNPIISVMTENELHLLFSKIT